MIKALLLITGLILAISGLCELIHSICLLLASPSGPHKSCTVIWLNKRKAWQQLRFARLQLRWLGRAYADSVIAVTSGVSSEEIEQYKISFDEGFIFCPIEALENVIRSISGEQNTDGRNNESELDRGNSGTDRADYI